VERSTGPTTSQPSRKGAYLVLWETVDSPIDVVETLKKQYEMEAVKAEEEGKDYFIPSDRDIGSDIEIPMKLDPSTKHFVCKRCGLYATREQIADIRDRLNQREFTKEDKQYDYLEWWQKSKKEKQA